jgi:uncharacterized protein YifE (UPF0438 family)
MSTISDHDPLSRSAFRFRCSRDIFPPAELAALASRGEHMEALAAGTIPPGSAQDEHFLKVDRDEAEPETVDERAWLRLKGRREFEREESAAAPPEPPENYGIIDWDKEKCWW